MQNTFVIKLADDDVIKLKYASHYFNNDLQTFSVKDAYGFVRRQLNLMKEDAPTYKWIGEGVPARILRSTYNSQGWIEGEISLSLVFQLEGASSAVTQAKAFILASEDVIKIPLLEARIGNLNEFCISQLISQLRSNLGLTNPSASKYYWLDRRGIEASVLRSGVDNSGWQTGIVRLQLEFLPKVAITSAENSVIGHSELESLRQPIIS